MLEIQKFCKSCYICTKYNEPHKAACEKILLYGIHVVDLIVDALVVDNSEHKISSSV